MAGLHSISSDIDKLKQTAGKCRVIKTSGDVCYLIDSHFPNSTYSLKFQVLAPEADGRPIIISLAKGPDRQIVAAVQNAIRQTQHSSMHQTYLTALTTLQEHVGNLHEQDETLNKLQTKGSNSKTKLSTADAVKKSSKKPSMRTATDVVKRFNWDSSLDKEVVIVGYIDRFTGIQEQPFTAFNWVNPAAADWSDLNIPEHRIEYFKYDGVIVWEKRSRTDNVFGSVGGKTIYEVLGLESENKAAAAVAADIASDSATSTSDSDSENDIEPIITISALTSNPLAQARVTSTSPQTTNQMPKSVPANKPNHFIALPISDSQLLSQITSLNENHLKDVNTSQITNGDNLHVTLCALRIDTLDDLDAASQAIFNFSAAVSEDVEQNPEHGRFNVNGLDTFFGRVLYARVDINEVMKNLVLQMRADIQASSIRIFDDNTFVPHITVVKYYRNDYGGIDLNDVVQSFNRSDRILGANTLSKVSLFSMEKDDKGHYIEKFSCEFN